MAVPAAGDFCSEDLQGGNCCDISRTTSRLPRGISWVIKCAVMMLPGKRSTKHALRGSTSFWVYNISSKRVSSLCSSRYVFLSLISVSKEVPWTHWDGRHSGSGVKT